MPYQPGDRVDYLCDACGHTIHTRVVDRGRPSPDLACPKCGCIAERIRNTTGEEATHEWYRPIDQPQLVEYMRRGGLILRPIGRVP